VPHKEDRRVLDRITASRDDSAVNRRKTDDGDGGGRATAADGCGDDGGVVTMT